MSGSTPIGLGSLPGEGKDKRGKRGQASALLGVSNGQILTSLSPPQLSKLLEKNAYPTYLELNEDCFQLSSHRCLEQLPNIVKEMDLFGNNLRRLGPLSQLSKLKRLTADENHLTDVDVDGLSSLELLSLQRNELRSLPLNLSSLSSLVHLNLAKNQLYATPDGEWKQLSKLHTLKVLNLEHNRIDMTIQQYYSFILSAIKAIPKLEYLSFEGNPLQETIQSFVHFNISELPKLKYFNWKQITKSDRQEAARLESQGLWDDHILPAAAVNAPLKAAGDTLAAKAETQGRSRSNSVMEWIPDSVNYASVPNREELLGLDQMLEGLSTTDSVVGDAAGDGATDGGTEGGADKQDYLSMLDNMLDESDTFDLSKPLPKPTDDVSQSGGGDGDAHNDEDLAEDELDALLEMAGAGGGGGGASASKTADGEKGAVAAAQQQDNPLAKSGKSQFLDLLDEMVADVGGADADANEPPTREAPRAESERRDSGTMTSIANLIERVPGARQSTASTYDPSEVDALLQEMSAAPDTEAPQAPDAEAAKPPATTSSTTIDDDVDALINEFGSVPSKQAPEPPSDAVRFSDNEKKAAADALEELLNDAAPSTATRGSKLRETTTASSASAAAPARDANVRKSALDTLDEEINKKEADYNDVVLSTDPKIRDAPYAHVMIPRADITIGSRIGLGIYADAHLGQFKETKVAVKKVRCQNFNDDFLRKLKRDTTALVDLPTHDHVAVYIGCVTEDDIAVVREYIDGLSLHNLLDDHETKLEPEYLVQVAREVAEAMCFLHANSVIHRHLHAHNVLLDESYHVHISDYGLTDLKDYIRWDTQQVGRPYFLAPELYPIVQKPAYTPAVDVFAYGMLLAHLFMRRQPFADKLPNEVVALIAAGQRVPLPSRFPFVFERLIDACWHQEASQRPNMAKVVRIVRQPVKQLLFVKPVEVEVDASNVDEEYATKVKAVVSSIRLALLSKEAHSIAKGLKALGTLAGDKRAVPFVAASALPQLLIAHLGKDTTDTLRLAVILSLQQWVIHEPFKEAFRRAQGFPMLIACSEARSRKVVHAMCVTLGLIASRAADYAESLRVAGAVETALEVANTGVHTNNVEMIVGALKTITSLLAAINSLAQFNRAGGVSTVKDLLEYADVQVSARAVDVLSRCAADADMRPQVFDAGLLQRLVKYVGGDSLPLASMGIQHLHTLAKIDKSVIERIRAVGAKEALSNARSVHSSLIARIDALDSELGA